MTNTPVLALPDFTQQFVVETDAFDIGLGCSSDAVGQVHCISQQTSQQE
jgi:hypothetical protein